jgi:hypothetical protein
MNYDMDLNVHLISLLAMIKEEASELNYGYAFSPPIKGSIEISYPLKNPDVLNVENIKTTGELLWEIAQYYDKIYKEESETSGVKNLFKDSPILNREETFGVHGIYGHAIEDLFIEQINIDTETEIIQLFMGS